MANIRIFTPSCNGLTRLKDANAWCRWVPVGCCADSPRFSVSESLTCALGGGDEGEESREAQDQEERADLWGFRGSAHGKTKIRDMAHRLTQFTWWECQWDGDSQVWPMCASHKCCATATVITTKQWVNGPLSNSRHLGLSENSVPNDPMVNDHYP